MRRDRERDNPFNSSCLFERRSFVFFHRFFVVDRFSFSCSSRASDVSTRWTSLLSRASLLPSSVPTPLRHLKPWEGDVGVHVRTPHGTSLRLVCLLLLLLGNPKNGEDFRRLPALSGLSHPLATSARLCGHTATCLAFFFYLHCNHLISLAVSLYLSSALALPTHLSAYLPVYLSRAICFSIRLALSMSLPIPH